MTTRIALLRGAQVVIDLSVLSAALWLGFLIRFDWEMPAVMWQSLLVLWPYVVGIEYGLLVAFGVPRSVWRYVGLREVNRILLAGAGSTLLLAGVRVAMGLWFRELTRHAVLPYGVIAINFTLAFLGIAGVRVLRRLLSEKSWAGRRLERGPAARRTLLVGAGQSGLLIAKEIQNRPELGITAVGFLDDDPAKQGTLVHGVPVLGAIAAAREIAPAMAAEQALITLGSAGGPTIRRIAELCSRAALDVKIIPGVHQLVGGELNLSRIRDVAIEDLLRRDPIDLDSEVIARSIQGRTVLVTGAGGSVGSELCRQVSQFKPARLLLVERAENALFEIHREILQAFPGQQSLPCLADICDRHRMAQLLAQYRPDVLFHAAAHKHVPLMEDQPAEAVKNNVQGTRLLADLAEEMGVATFVMISTDKAVRPTSVMGASKRAAEIYVQSRARVSHTRFVTVRFGNVLGSAGSVVPIFKKQIAAGGPVTVTHPEMERYFMTIPEATQLVLQAGTMGAGGEIFILDMGEPVKIVDLARNLIQLSGLSEEEIRIEFKGIRPGEKLHEELSTEEEGAKCTRHPKILVGCTSAEDVGDLQRRLDSLLDAAREGASERIRSELRRIVPDYDPSRVGAAPVAPSAAAAHARAPSAMAPSAMAPSAMASSAMASVAMTEQREETPSDLLSSPQVATVR
jgi:FlaA1/EpsC-like NDP-sugar epimerase